MRIVSSLLAVTLLGGAVELPPLRVVLTDSMPRGLYRVTHEPITRGVIVEECLPLELATFAKERGYLEHGKCPGQVWSVVKKVVAVEGDEVDLEDAWITVNGQLILNAETHEKDSKGRPLPAVPRGTFTLKAGEVFLLATHSVRSWDGRYTGATKTENIIATLRPVWTEGE